MKRWFLASALALVAQASLAEAPKPPPTASPQVSPWARVPTQAEFNQALPPETVKNPVIGRAMMRCHAQENGSIADCAIIGDSSGGAGYGKALLALAPLYRLKPEAIAAAIADGQVIVPYYHLQFDKAADWLRRPSAQDLLVVWPKAAWSRGIGGKATISCLVSVQGALYDCVTLWESPPGQNFGAAAIALTPQFLMKPATLNGQPVISEARLPINFAWQGGAGGGGPGRKMVQPAMAWLEAPSYAQVIAAYPKKARAEGVVGRATLDCQFMSTGRVEHCSTLTEEPRGQGFADAAKALAKQFQAYAKTSDGTPLSGAGVQLPFAFDRSMQTETAQAVGKPQWASLPTAEDTIAAFATVAKSVEGTVRVTLNCTVQPGGGVSDCSVVREDPAGKGVGQAALTLAPHFRLTTWTMEGLPTVGASVNIPLRFEGRASPADVPAKP